MKTPILILFMALALGGAGVAQDLKENKFFQAVEGKWKGEGTVTNANQDELPAQNQLEAAFVDDGQMFTIKGQLKIGDPNTAGDATALEYRWEYVQGTIEGLLAGRFVNVTAGGDPSDFEVAIDEANLSAKLTQISGGSGEPRIEMVNKIVDGKYIVSFTMTDSNGQQQLSGELKFDKEE